ncbi:ATP synthase subunit b [Planctomycetes bacterium Poly30]|uniref:ATP synthase subunit b n=1 Tax=Saltatorellus ferox TaxID=2528018 RepID=A0A518ERM8_9BACT|nr:ATP synthase subunit b [Planctomycetes bacterium Poly30]
MLTHAILERLPLLLAEGGFNVFDLNGAGNFLWTLIIFFLALPLMWKMVFGPITAALIERDSKASAAIHAAEAASEAAERSRAEVELALGNANAEAKKTIQAATSRAEARERDIIDTAKKEADAMVTQARSQIQAERDKALAEIRGEVVGLTMQAATQVLGRSVGSEDDRRLAQDIVGAN